MSSETRCDLQVDPMSIFGRVVIMSAIDKPLLVLTTLAAIFFGAGHGTILAADNEDADPFGDIFAHPRDRHYIPGTAPSRAELGDFGIDYTDQRGEVSRWEYRKDGRVITRELWTDNNGEAKGRLGIGRRF